MKYTITTVLSFCAFWATFLSFKNGYFAGINNLFLGLPHLKWLVWFSFIATDLGGMTIIILGSILLVLFLVVENRYREALYTVVSLLGGVAFQTSVKNILAIERPASSLVGTVGYAFPSGHTNMTTILFVSAFLYVFGKSELQHRRRVMCAICVLVILSVGFSRVYLEAHWVSDVVAGLFFGLFWATLPLSLDFLYRKYESA